MNSKLSHFCYLNSYRANGRQIYMHVDWHSYKILANLFFFDLMNRKADKIFYNLIIFISLYSMTCILTKS